jgi:hypothetical protein
MAETSGTSRRSFFYRGRAGTALGDSFFPPRYDARRLLRHAAASTKMAASASEPARVSCRSRASSNVGDEAEPSAIADRAQ